MQRTAYSGTLTRVRGFNTEPLVSFDIMSLSDASTIVGEPLIQVISEHVNEPSERSGTPVLFTPPEPSPPLPSENLMDGSERPPELPDALLHLQNSGHHLQMVSCRLW